MKRRLAILVLFAAAAAHAQQVIVVRHGERATQAADSPLSAAGRARAKELARVLADVNIGAIYATQFIRTQQTVAPLAAEKKLTPVIVNTTDTYARDLVNDIREHHAGQTVVVASHADRIPDLLKQLGIANPPQMTMTEYDDLFLVTGGKLLVLRYGANAR